jgi:hypothetical protein
VRLEKASDPLADEVVILREYDPNRHEHRI